MAETVNLKIVKPVSEHDANKIVTLNDGTDNLDAVVGGLLTLSVAGAANVTLTRAQALNAVFKFTGALTGSLSVLFPVAIGSARGFTVWNATTGAFSLTIKTTTVGSVGVQVTQGERAQLFHDGTDVLTADIASGGGGAVSSVHGRTGPVVAVSGDYTWDQLNFTTSSIGDIDDTAFAHMDGTVAVTQGGTGLGSIPAGKLLHTSAADTITAATLGTNLSWSGTTLNASGSTVASSIENVSSLPFSSGPGHVRYRDTDDTYWVGIASGASWFQLYTGNVQISSDRIDQEVQPKTGNWTVAAAKPNTFFTNEGAAAGITFTLPTPAAGLTYEFYRDENFLVTIDIAGAVTIRVGTSVTTAGGNVTLDAVGSKLRIVAINATKWVGDLTGAATFN